MRSNIDFHGTDEVHATSIAKSITKLENGNTANGAKLPPTDIVLLEEYADELMHKVTAPRASATISRLVAVSKWFHDYGAINDAAYNTVMAHIRNDERYSESYKQDMSRDLKRYATWLKARGAMPFLTDQGLSAKCVVAAPQQRSDDVIMSAEEIDQIIAAERNPKYKCYFILLADSGARPSEIAALRWSDVKTICDDLYLYVTQYKGGRSNRMVPLSEAAKQALIAYKRYTCSSMDEYVFPSQRGGTISYQAYYNEFRRVLKALGWDYKPYTLYSFRHSRITAAIKSDVNLEIAKRVFWGNGRTQMIDTYTHLTTQDLINGMRGH